MPVAILSKALSNWKQTHNFKGKRRQIICNEPYKMKHTSFRVSLDSVRDVMTACNVVGKASQDNLRSRRVINQLSP